MARNFITEALFPAWVTSNPEVFSTLEDFEWFPRLTDLYAGLYIGAVFSVLRFLLTTFVYEPVAKKVLGPMNISDNYLKLSNATLLNAFTKSKRITADEVESLSKEVNMSTDEIVAWGKDFREMKRYNVAVQKYNEAAWRFMVYTFLAAWTWYVVPKKDWYQDIRITWQKHPYEEITSDIWWLYFLEGGFYVHLFFFQFVDVKRKDFLEMMIHHIVTLFLLIFSYQCNFTSIGCCVLLCHDISDVFLELAKLFNYAKWQMPCDCTFVIFASSFAYFRLYVFPFWVVHSALYHATAICGPFPGLFIYQILLVILQLLHVFWFYLIMRMVFKLVMYGKVEKDERSESDEEDTEDVINARSKKEE